MSTSESLRSEIPLESEVIKAEEPKAKARNKRLRKILIYVLLATLIIYLLSLIVVNTQWAKSKLTNKLEQHTGLEWQVGSITWIPFGKIYVNDVETVSQEYHDSSGGIILRSVAVSPIWTNLITGDLIWNEIRIDGVDLDVERV